MSEVRVRPMTAAEFDAFRDRAIKGYAAEHVRAGTWSPERAEALAAKETDELLPDGPNTAGMLLLVAEAPPVGIVGVVWVALDRGEEGAWIYDIEIIPGQRGRGYGRALLRAAEREVQKCGGSSIGLNVFRGNAVARRLYESSGYEVTALHMRKALEPEGETSRPGSGLRV